MAALHQHLHPQPLQHQPLQPQHRLQHCHYHQRHLARVHLKKIKK
jgi:hypothetical protein